MQPTGCPILSAIGHTGIGHRIAVPLESWPPPFLRPASGSASSIPAPASAKAVSGRPRRSAHGSGSTRRAVAPCLSASVSDGSLPLADRLSAKLAWRRLVLVDGGADDGLHALGLPLGEAPEGWCFDRPEAVPDVHRGLAAAGDVSAALDAARASSAASASSTPPCSRRSSTRFNALRRFFSRRGNFLLHQGGICPKYRLVFP